MKIIIKKALILFTEILSPITILSSLWLKFVRRIGIGKLTNFIFSKVGLLPVQDHYYQPLINPKKHLKKSLREDRYLPGIDLNVSEQLELLKKFRYNEELLRIPLKKPYKRDFYYDNGSFESGDAEYLYNMIRYYKPKKIIEIGSGYSTLMAVKAIEKNKQENDLYNCKHICIEPYEMSWLKDLEVELIRERVEDVNLEIFKSLDKDDILFIDSSHIIRPQGDVLFEYLEVLPNLNKGVLIHIHDIFTPKDYPDEWVYKEHRLWNEQYLLEAFLTCNTNFKIIGALNYLINNHRAAINSKCPILAKQKDRGSGSMWLVRL